MTIMQDPTASNFAAPMEYVPPQQQHDHDKKKDNTYNNNDGEKQPPPLPTGVAAIPGVPTQDEDSSRRILLPSIDITNSARSNESRDDPRNNNTGCRFHHNENHNNSNMKKKRSEYDHNTNNGNTNHGTDIIDNNGGDDNDNVDNNDEDQAERNVAWVIHFCLVFFMGLVLLSIGFTIQIALKSTTRYAFVTVVVLGIMIVFYIFLLYFVDDTVISQHQQLRPIRRNIIHVCDTTSMFLHEEYSLFVRDWKQATHNVWLLTAEADINNRNEEADETTRSRGRHQEQQQQQQQNTTKKSSTLFKIIKPFFKLKQKFVVRRTKRNTIHLNQPQ